MAWRPTRTAPEVKSAAEFLIAQFKAAADGRAALAKGDLEQDPALNGLLALFRFADRNRDNRLSLTELETYLKLIELGIRAQLWIKVVDHGHNPFHFLDSDGDGRLSCQELAGASKTMGDEAANRTRRFHLDFGGPAVRTWGGVPIPAPNAVLHTIVRRTTSLPRWFQAMDRNGDGVISPLEFAGPPEIFRRLDSNGDGLITPAEALHEGRK
jgi:Ca2+-binding EF-hand superfamily protein